MTNRATNQNRQFEAMLIPAIERLKKYTPEDICQRASITYDGNEFALESLGQEIHISYPAFQIREELDMWHHLTLLQYLDTANGQELSNTFSGLVDMPGGSARGMGYDREIQDLFTGFFSKINAEEFRSACLTLGAEIIDGKADVTAVFMYAPRFPVCINFWEADDEFSASGKALVDKNAHCYLEIEAAGVACVSVVTLIKDALFSIKNRA